MLGYSIYGISSDIYHPAWRLQARSEKQSPLNRAMYYYVHYIME